MRGSKHFIIDTLMRPNAEEWYLHGTVAIQLQELGYPPRLPSTGWWATIYRLVEVKTDSSAYWDRNKSYRPLLNDSYSVSLRFEIGMNVQGTMREMIVNMEGVKIPHKVVKIMGDGSCLFSALSYTIYDTPTKSSQVRREIVTFIVDNWNEYQAYTVNKKGDIYDNEEIYEAEMLKAATYGGTSELMAAAMMFRRKIEVFKKGKLIARFGEMFEDTSRLRFSGPDMKGHFDVLVMLDNLGAKNN